MQRDLTYWATLSTGALSKKRRDINRAMWKFVSLTLASVAVAGIGFCEVATSRVFMWRVLGSGLFVAGLCLIAWFQSRETDMEEIQLEHEDLPDEWCRDAVKAFSDPELRGHIEKVVSFERKLTRGELRCAEAFLARRRKTEQCKKLYSLALSPK